MKRLAIYFFILVNIACGACTRNSGNRSINPESLSKKLDTMQTQTLMDSLGFDSVIIDCHIKIFESANTIPINFEEHENIEHLVLGRNGNILSRQKSELNSRLKNKAPKAISDELANNILMACYELYLDPERTHIKGKGNARMQMRTQLFSDGNLLLDTTETLFTHESQRLQDLMYYSTTDLNLSYDQETIDFFRNLPYGYFRE